MSGLENVALQVAAVNQKFARILYDMRLMVLEGGLGACKSCGYPTTPVSYRYEIENGQSVTERVCHDCAYPKVGSYLREKEEKRQKEQAKKEKREYAEKWLEHHQTEAEQGHECNQCEEERAEFWGGDYACNCGAVKPPCRACLHPGNPIAQEAGCQHKEREISE